MKIEEVDAEFATWPEVPAEQRQKVLYHRGMISEKAAFGLTIKGWKPVDVRLLPNATDDDRRLALKAWLEGLRFGTIELDPKLAKWLELEAKVYEIHKGVGEKPVEAAESSVQSTDYVLSFGTERSYTTTADEKLTLAKRKRGKRPKDVADDPEQ